MRDLPDLLFHELDLRQTLENNLQRARQEVDGIPEKQFLQASDDELTAHVFSKCEAVPLELHEDRMEMETEESQVDVRHHFDRAVFDRSRPALIPAVNVRVTIPFTGDAVLWKCQPSTFGLNPPRANVLSGRGDQSGEIELLQSRPADNVSGDELKREIDNMLSSIRSYLENSKRDVDAHNHKLHTHIQQCVAQRRARLGTHSQIASVLNIPLKRKPGSPDFSPLPVKRRLVKPLPAASNRPPEPGIRDEDYTHILKVIRHEGRTFEATPRTFAVHDEEELRDIIVAHLNGHFEGDATGETFRRHGKTDIRIEDQNRAAFVAECKVWRGPKELTKAVDQLLSYLTWRDCKAALIFFNKDVAGFTGIQQKIPEALSQHPNCVRALNSDQAGEWRYKFRSAEDEQRHVIVHVFLFNLFVSGVETEE
ncbi:MAG: hypothetical protein DWQ34_13145 [Planctomycetota bacterium]|nr:MAG: hypothetical protein DWQ34_13145 [Planctomycetota bacterium]REK28038.1 MAG: hypothetical protein DWQ41_06395 [Planctomycetota bacterium]REK37565.1 MAG: hypothetical protein DWQ45_06080 [Planctomycetota bacterium]